MKIKDMKHQDFVDAGYIKHKQPILSSCDYMYQKCVNDFYGKKYYIDVYVYVNKYSKYGTNYSFSVYYQNSEPYTMVTYEWVEDSDIFELEERFEMQWLLAGKPYYEEYGE